MDTSYPSEKQRKRSCLFRLLQISFIGLVLITILGYFVVVPALERVVQGFGGLLSSVAQSIRPMLQAPFDKACRHIEESSEVGMVLGIPVTFPPIEQTEWIDLHKDGEVEVTFDVKGSLGVGRAYVVVVTTEKAIEIRSITVTLDERTVFIPIRQ